MQKVELKAVLAGVRPGGCVQPYLAGFATELISAGHTVLSARDFMRSAAHLGRWMDSRNIGVGRLDEAAIARFARHKCECPGVSQHGQRPSRRVAGRVRQFAEHLVRLGAASSWATPSPRALPSPLIGFRAWMHCQRGIKARTIDRYEGLIEKMLPALGDVPAKYDASVVRQSLLRTIKPLSCGYAKTYVIALRAFLRFLAAQGRCRAHLDRAVPTVPEWKLSALPRYLEADDVERLIASCDLSKPCGVRDRAILLLLARLGLRAGDITAMRLGDLDWCGGTVRVLGKERKEVRLPLPQDAGDALIEYLVKVRPRVDVDRVFLCVHAPVRPFAGSASVSDIVRLALQRADIQNPPSRGAHLLRHSAATAMLRFGASLDLVAAVLRHESADMTAHYAKVHIEMLRQIAQPWPEESPC
jgi:site-specific recombinase XerD